MTTKLYEDEKNDDMIKERLMKNERDDNMKNE